MFGSAFTNKEEDIIIKNEYKMQFNTFVYIINEYTNSSIQWKKENAIDKLGEDVGARFYEALYFKQNNFDKGKQKRFIKILDILQYIKKQLWVLLFNKEAKGLETFIGDRFHSKTKAELKEYVVYDIDPIYCLRYANENYVFKFYSAILKGFLCYGGFPCKVLTHQQDEKDKNKCEFIIQFEESVFDKKGQFSFKYIYKKIYLNFIIFLILL